MPANDPGRLAIQQNADVLTYLFNFNMFPAGKSELAHDAQLLKQIRLEATKPAPTPTNRRRSALRPEQLT
jgi:hypothetical protein